MLCHQVKHYHILTLQMKAAIKEAISVTSIICIGLSYHHLINIIIVISLVQ
jgi:hypothetical protein